MKLGTTVLLGILMTSAIALAEPTTRPATDGGGVDAEKMLDQLLRTQAGGAKPIQPMAPETDKIDVGSSKNAVAPKAPSVALKREGDIISRRDGRVQRTADDQGWEFHFESDGKSLQDPPMLLLPNLRLTMIENSLHDSNRDLRFTVTGTITEYHGRNYLLVEKFTVVPDNTRP